jgi:phage terminase small subunit
MALSDKEMAFVDAYVETGHPGDAAQKAGFARRRGKDLLQKLEIAAEIGRVKSLVRNETEFDLATTLTEIDEAINWARSNKHSSLGSLIALRVKLRHPRIDKEDDQKFDIAEAVAEGRRRSLPFAGGPGALRRIIADAAKDEADLRALAARAERILAEHAARAAQMEAEDNAEADRILAERGLPRFTLSPLTFEAAARSQPAPILPDTSIQIPGSIVPIREHRPNIWD